MLTYRETLWTALSTNSIVMIVGLNNLMKISMLQNTVFTGNTNVVMNCLSR